MLKGNHDYWWNGLKKLNEYIKENNFNNIEFLYNNSFEAENHIIVGTRGWNLNSQTEEDEKIIKREIIRLELSIQNGIEKFGEDKQIIVCMHYPPTTKELGESSKFIQLMKSYKVKRCIYGHLHGEALSRDVIEGDICKIKLELVSSDYLDFKLKKIF